MFNPLNPATIFASLFHLARSQKTPRRGRNGGTRKPRYPKHLYAPRPFLSHKHRRNRQRLGSLLVSLQDRRNRKRTAQRIADKRFLADQRKELITARRQAAQQPQQLEIL